MKKVLLTGGAGYIGSHTYVALVESGYQPVIFDNFSNAKDDLPDRLELITNTHPIVHRGDVLNEGALADLFSAHEFDAVIHFAGLKAVGESVEQPLRYARTNLVGMMNLLEAMEHATCHNIVFSSTATVYGEPETFPITEDTPTGFTNPYSFNKLTCEHILNQAMIANPKLSVGILRYFNPAGAHSSSLIGEDPMGIPNNLMPYIAKVAVGEMPFLRIFGDDYPTKDGTGIRDYIHIEDLADAHVLSLSALLSENKSHCLNIGTGEGYSVFDMLNAYQAACGFELAHEVHPRRSGDVPMLLADPSRAEAELGFKASRGLSEMCESSWKWISRNKNSV